MASTIAVRQELNKRGISNNRIGYDPNTQTVLVDNKPFLKPQQITEGTSYADPNAFNQAYQQLNQSRNAYRQVTNEIQGIPQGMTWQERLGYFQQNPELQQQEYKRVQDVINLGKATGDDTQRAKNYLNQFLQATGYNPNVNPYEQQLNPILQQLIEQGRNPQQVNVQDIIGSPQYEAYQQLAQRQADQAIRQAQESLGGAGFGRSTRLAERAQDIQNEANQYLQTQVLPQLISQEQQRQQQQLGNLMNVLGLLQGQQGVYDTRQQREFQNQLAQENQALQAALARTQNAGKVVNEEDAAILGVPVGTPSFEAEQAAIANQLSRARLSSGGGGGEEGYSDSFILRILTAYDNADPATKRLLENQFPEIVGGAGVPQANLSLDIFLRNLDPNTDTLESVRRDLDQDFLDGFINQDEYNMFWNAAVDYFNRLEQQRAEEQRQRELENQRRLEKEQQSRNILNPETFDPFNISP